MPDDSALAKLCKNLVNDPNLWERFRTEPEKVVAEANLSDEEKKLFVEGPLDKLQSHLGMDAAFFSAMIVSPVRR